MLTRIDHIGIAVHSIEQKIPLYRDTLGMQFLGDEIVESQHVRVAFFQLGESMIELLEPTSEHSPIARFLDKYGEGIHHLAAATDDILAARQRALDHGLRLLSDAPVDGAHGKLVSFVHPKDTGGVLLEFTQRLHP